MNIRDARAVMRNKTEIGECHKFRRSLRNMVSKQIGTSFEQIAAIGQEQVASTQQISTFIEQIEEMSNQLKQYAKKL